MSFALADAPDWHGAARELVGGLCAEDAPERRVTLLEEVCTGLGDALYPAFLQILHAIERDGDLPAREVVARTLVDALVSGRLPSGRLPAWGGTALPSDSPFGRVRSLGPLEYLCAWRAQPSSLAVLPDDVFERVATSLLELVESHPPAVALYAHKLLADVDDPLDGALSRTTREGLAALAQRWHDGGSAAEASAAFLAATAESPDPLAALLGTRRPDALG